MKQHLTLPNILTLFRLILSPLALPLLLVYLLPLNTTYTNGFLAVLFIIFGLTDFFDGYFARRYKQESRLGAMLDPIADKFLIFSTLIALLTINRIYFYWVILLIGREFFMIGLRQVALEHAIRVPVSWLGKVKTAMQMVYIVFVLINPHYAVGYSGAPWWNAVQDLLLFLTLTFSLYSAQNYYRRFLKAFNAEPKRLEHS